MPAALRPCMSIHRNAESRRHRLVTFSRRSQGYSGRLLTGTANPAVGAVGGSKFNIQFRIRSLLSDPTLLFQDSVTPKINPAREFPDRANRANCSVPEHFATLFLRIHTI